MESDHRETSTRCTEPAAYTLKIRSGCAGGGKGALVQTEKSATLSTLQDQTLFQPVVYDARGNGDGKIVPTITGDHENRITDYTAIAIERETFKKDLEERKAFVYELNHSQSVYHRDYEDKHRERGKKRYLGSEFRGERE